MTQRNLLLLAFDILCLPITIIRILLIYISGSKYNINGFEFLDIMMHANNKYFNQQEDKTTIDTINTDIRVSINRDSQLHSDTIHQHQKPIQDSYVPQITQIPQVLQIQKNLPVQESEQKELTEKEKLLKLVEEYRDSKQKIPTKLDKIDKALSNIDEIINAEIDAEVQDSTDIFSNTDSPN
jgi:hypothetical protein